jgi:hypothetical protein
MKPRPRLTQGGLVVREPRVSQSAVALQLRRVSQPRDHRNRDPVAFGDGRQCLPVSAALDCFLALVVRKLSRPAELGARSHSPLRPSPVRSRIRSRSKSAMAAKSVDNSRPCELDVSHSGSPSDRNEAPALPIRSISSSNSRVSPRGAQTRSPCHPYDQLYL